ncbi:MULTISPECIES: tryptophan halogenase family protein [unclassified Sphingomonas]|uniref:tryptophan halogenase family protein n=1 Tax=Novosphingobium rhizosphaerae TaxID=1551649 RepID=UPI0015CEEA89
MDSQAARSITIVGGGTAGWMCAAALAHFVGENTRITLVESDAIGTIGVGEATIPQIRMFNQTLGIDETDFIRATGATFKLGIEFAGWLRPGHSYLHAFGDVGRDIGLGGFRHFWSRAHRLGLARPLGDYSVNDLAARAGKMHDGAPLTNRNVPAVPHAFHFDAGLYAAYLRRYAQKHGVVRQEGTIVSVARDGQSGDVTTLTLSDGRVVAGDLFIDCSGLRALLIQDTLGVGFDDWSHLLPANSAVAVPSERTAPLTPYTRATAHAVGWQWRIPLQHRTGNGRVYCSAFISDDEAAAGLLANLDGAPLADPRVIRFATGRTRQAWSHNVIAMGLASGFLEPLESTSIHLIQSMIARIMAFGPTCRPAPAVRATFNRQFADEMERIRDFIVLHYWANEREEPFWQACRSMALPDSLAEKIELFRSAGHLFRDQSDLFSEVGWLQVLVGQGIVPATSHALAEAVSESDLAAWLDTLHTLYAREVAAWPTHADYIARHCAAPSPQGLVA